MQQAPADPWLDAQIDAALAPYVGRLPASEIAWMRERLAETLAGEKHAAELVKRARPRMVEQSGEVRCGPFEEEAERGQPRRRDGTG